jgi:uncharacterized protein YidB (DUF937 family)
MTDANDPDKGGRPALDPADKKSSTIGVRVTAGERARLQEKADALGLRGLSTFLRKAGLGRQLPTPPPSIPNADCYQELGRVGKNLNDQLVALHGVRAELVENPALGVEAMREIAAATRVTEQTLAEVRKLRALLIGIDGGEVAR